jgi:hypothetical protein
MSKIQAECIPVNKALSMKNASDFANIKEDVLSEKVRGKVNFSFHLIIKYR